MYSYKFVPKFGTDLYVCRNKLITFSYRKTVIMTISNIPEYLEHHRREYLTDEFAFSSYNPPNTMYQVSNDVDEILLTVSFHAIKMWHRSLSLLKRSKDPSQACS